MPHSNIIAALRALSPAAQAQVLREAGMQQAGCECNLVVCHICGYSGCTDCMRHCFSCNQGMCGEHEFEIARHRIKVCQFCHEADEKLVADAAAEFGE